MNVVQTDSQSEITILMAVCNGAAYLPQQLSSIASQSHVKWQLIASDDNSTDGSLLLLQHFSAAQAAGQVQILSGPGLGAVQNFRHLLRHAPMGKAVAFADQDDIWLPDKLQRGLAMLQPLEGPALYGATVMIADKNGQELRSSTRPNRPPSFRNALLQNIFPGNTILLNAAALGLLQASEARLQRAGLDYVMHDWWAYLLISGAGGQMVFDAQPALRYRQHASNVIGENAGLAASVKRLRHLMRGRYAAWLTLHLQSLTEISDLLTAETLAVMQSMVKLQSSPSMIERALILKRSRIYAQSHRAFLGLWFATLIGRL